MEEGQTYKFSAKVFLEQNSSKISLTTKKSGTNYYTWPAEILNPESGIWLEISGQFNKRVDGFHIYCWVDSYENFYVDEISISRLRGPLIDPYDTDSDGMLDSWEYSIFGNLENLPDDDYDNDGFINILEHRSGKSESIFIIPLL